MDSFDYEIPESQPIVIDGYEVIGTDPRADDYVDPTEVFHQQATQMGYGGESLSAYHMQQRVIFSSEDYKRANAQRKADLEYAKLIEESQAAEIQRIEDEKAQRLAKQAQKENQERQEAIVSDDFQKALSLTNANSMELDEEEAIGYFNTLYGR